MKHIIAFFGIMAVMVSTAVAGGDIAPVEPVVEQPKNFYVGGALTASQVYDQGDSHWFNDTASAETGYGLGVQAGYVFFRTGDFSSAVEVRANRTFWSFADDVDGEVTSYGAFVKPEYSFGDYGVYGLVGYGQTRLTGTGFKQTENGFAYGGGVEYALTESFAVFVDYVVNPEIKETPKDIENDTISIGVNYKF